jgi:predicted RNA-binding protein with PIN domain
MAQHFIIDGYNLIKQSPLTSRLIPPYSAKGGVNLEGARSSLIRFLAVCRPQGKNKVTVVFDGKPGNTSCAGIGPVEIIFTQGESADDKIKRMVESSKNPKSVIVVTNDREIQYFARAHQAQVKTVEEFLAKFNTPRQSGACDEKAIGPIEAAQINEEMKKIWLK